jgi:SAM-dependent methyltransferase
MNGENWWREYFEEYYLLIEGVKSREVTLRSADFIEQAFDLPKGSRILDLGCGYGRLSVELAKRGLSPRGPRPLFQPAEDGRRVGKKGRRRSRTRPG